MYTYICIYVHMYITVGWIKQQNNSTPPIEHFSEMTATKQLSVHHIIYNAYDVNAKLILAQKPLPP